MAVRENKIRIVGCGPGALEYVTPLAGETIRQADVLVGAKRLLDLFPDLASERIEAATDIEKLLDVVARKYDGRASIVILVTGDPGLFSLSKRVIERFGRKACEIIPGISSVQLAFARLGLDWSDVTILSAHGRELELSGNEWPTTDKIAILSDGAQGSLRKAAHGFETLRGEHVFYVCENLSLADERVYQVEAPELASVTFPSRTVILIIRKGLVD